MAPSAPTPTMMEQFIRFMKDELSCTTDEQVYDHINSHAVSKMVLISYILRFLEFYYNG